MTAERMNCIPALILAAGLSSRMGAFKPLLALGGRPLIGHVIAALQGSGRIGEIVVVTGHRAAELEAALPAEVRRVHNTEFAEGEMLSSLRVGIKKLGELEMAAAGGFLLAFADQPAVLSATVAGLVERFLAERAPLVLPVHGGKKGHPIIISAALVGEIERLGREETLRVVVQRHLAGASLVAVTDAATLEDLDTPEDFVRAQAAQSRTGR